MTALVAALEVEPPAYEASVPDGLPDRAADAWEPLLAIADAAGGGWPARARLAAVVLHATRAADDSLGLRLLSDIRLAFDRRDVERLSTADLIAALREDDESPWADDRVPLRPHRLGQLLAPFDIASKQMRLGSANVKGYARASFVDAWDRYLAPSPSPAESKHRNSEHDRRFDVSVVSPTDGGDHSALAMPIEEDYPRSAWDQTPGDEQLEVDPPVASPLPGSDVGGGL